MEISQIQEMDVSAYPWDGKGKGHTAQEPGRWGSRNFDAASEGRSLAEPEWEGGLLCGPRIHQEETHPHGDLCEDPQRFSSLQPRSPSQT